MKIADDVSFVLFKLMVVKVFVECRGVRIDEAFIGGVGVLPMERYSGCFLREGRRANYSPYEDDM